MATETSLVASKKRKRNKKERRLDELMQELRDSVATAEASWKHDVQQIEYTLQQAEDTLQRVKFAFHQAGIAGLEYDVAHNITGAKVDLSYALSLSPVAFFKAFHTANNSKEISSAQESCMHTIDI